MLICVNLLERNVFLLRYDFMLNAIFFFILNQIISNEKRIVHKCTTTLFLIENFGYLTRVILFTLNCLSWNCKDVTRENNR